MKRFLALLLTAMMMLQVIGTGFALAEETPTVTITYTNEAGEVITETVDASDYYDKDGVFVYNNLPENGINAEVGGDAGIILDVKIDGDVKPTKNDYNTAVVIGNETNAEVIGNIETAGNGVSAGDQSSVTVTGDITAGHGEEIISYYDDEGNYVEEGIPTGTMTYTGSGIITAGNSEVHAEGNVTSEDTAVEACNQNKFTSQQNEDGSHTETSTTIVNQSEIVIDGNVTSQHMIGINAQGEAEVKVDGSVSSDDTAVQAYGEASVEIAGNVESGGGIGISAGSQTVTNTTWTYDAEWNLIDTTEEKQVELDNASVTVGGDVSSYGTAIIANENATVDVTGNADSKYGSGIRAENTYYWDTDTTVENNSAINVGGDLTAYGNGISAQGNAAVNVGGNVTAGHEYEAMNYWDGENYIPEGILTGQMTGEGTGISTSGSATVTVGGDLVSQGTAINAKGNSSVDVAGDAVGKYGSGIEATNGNHWDNKKQEYVTDDTNATVTVGGDLKAHGTAINAGGNSIIDIKGDAVSEYGSGIQIRNGEKWDNEKQEYISEESKTTVNVGGSLTAYGTAVNAKTNADIEIKGDVSSEQGAGILAENIDHWDTNTTFENNSVIDIGGDLTAYENGISAQGNAAVNVAGNVTAGHEYEVMNYWDENDNYIPDGIPTGQMTGEGTGISTSGSATVTVGGDLFSQGTAINAKGNSSVDVAGDAVGKYGSGIEATNGSHWDSEKQEYVTDDTNATITVGGDLKAHGTAINAGGNSIIDIKGDAVSEYGSGIHIRNGEKWDNEKQEYISEESKTTVNVGGSLTAYGTAVNARVNADIAIQGDVSSEQGSGIQAENINHRETDTTIENNSVIDVGGNLTAYGNGISAQGNAAVSVGGNVTAGHEYEVMNYWDGENYISEGIPTGKMTGEGTGISTSGSATVKVGGNLISQETAINAKGNSSVDVKGDTGSEYGSGIQATNSSHWDSEKQDYVTDETAAVVTVGGDLTAYETGINATGASAVSVGGNVTAGHEYESKGPGPGGEVQKRYSGNGISADGTASVTVGGNVTSQSTAIQTNNNAVVEVSGNAVSEHGNGISAINRTYGPYGVDPETNQSTVKVAGNLNAYDNGINAAGNSVINVDGNVTAGHEYEEEIEKYDRETGEWIKTGETETMYTGKGISISENARVTVGSNLTSQGNAIEANGNSSAIIKGNVTSEHGSGIRTTNSEKWDDEKQESIVEENKSTVNVDGSLTAYENGINASGTSVVSVGGDVTVGSEHRAGSGTGIYANGKAKVSVGGNLTSEDTAINLGSGWKSTNETIENEDGTITYIHRDICVPNQAEITVAGDVTSKNGTGVGATGEAKVAIGGSVKSAFTGISAEGDAAVLVGGDVEADKYIGIYAYKGNTESTYTRTMDAEGNIVNWNFENDYTAGAGDVTVGGNVTAKKNAAINMNGDSKVVVWGDVTGGFVEEKKEGTAEEPAPEPDGQAEEEPYEPSAREIAYAEAVENAFAGIELQDERNRGAVQIQLNEEENNGLLIVGGTITANEGNVPVVLNYTTDKETALPELPEMKIYEIAPSGGEYFDVNIYLEKELEFTYTDEETGKEMTEQTTTGRYVQLSEEDNSAVIEAIAKSIQYIIKLDAVHGAINLNGATYDDEYGIYTAHEEDEVSVTVRPDEGYDFNGITATGNYTLTNNGDGTWTIVIHRGGGVTISALITARSIPEEEPVVETAEPQKQWVHPALGKTIKFGHYDFDGDGTAEELEWIVVYVSGGYAKLAMTERVDEIPDDFEETAFTDEEKDAIKDDEDNQGADAQHTKWIKELDEGTAKRFFNDRDNEQIRISLFVKLNAIDY